MTTLREDVAVHLPTQFVCVATPFASNLTDVSGTPLRSHVHVGAARRNAFRSDSFVIPFLSIFFAASGREGGGVSVAVAPERDRQASRMRAMRCFIAVLEIDATGR